MAKLILKLLPKTTDDKLVLWLCYLAATIVLMDLTSVNIALPTISEYFKLGATKVSWLLMASMLSATSFAIIAGRIIDNYDVRSILSLGFVIFIIGTLLSSLVKNFEILIVIRFFQGFGEALLYVVGPAFIRKHLPIEKQQLAYGIWMASTAVGISFGPVIGGLIISMFSWHGVFLINFFLSLLGLTLMALRGLINFKVKTQVKSADYLGAFYSFITLVSFIVALNAAHDYGLVNVLTFISLSNFLVFMFLFFRREKKIVYPIFDLKLFRARNFNLAAIGFFIFFVVNVGSRFLRPFYFENVKMLSPQTSGLLMMISPLVMLIISPFSKAISNKIKPRAILIIANVLLAASMFWFSKWNAGTASTELIAAMILLGLSMGLYYPVNSFVGMKKLSPIQSGMGSAVISASKSLGKMMGVLLFAVYFSTLANDTVNHGMAYQNTFLFGSFIAIGGMLLSLGLKK